MEKAEHAARLRKAMAASGIRRQALADAVSKAPRTITNWTRGDTLPDPPDREKLRRLFPGYDDEGDQVEQAVRRSELTEDRQYDVIGYYKRRLREQREEATG